ncbi:HD domain-containing protein [Actinoplanes sp. NPDC089786]|uniref:HD domain-containing protein n=1 Tax=Actinoplanes sp. NPDC089786 TaxID=3155185 RepID=UPI00342A3E25
MPEDAEAIAAFGYELGLLKRVRRTGWWHAGVRDPESVAEHTMRTAQLAALIAAEEGADPARAAFLALWHDTQETRTGDLPHTATAYLNKPDPRQITADQTERLPTRHGRTSEPRPAAESPKPQRPCLPWRGANGDVRLGPGTRGFMSGWI